MKIKKIISLVLTVLLSVAVFYILGFVLGATWAGNLSDPSSFVYFNEVGWEGGSLLGIHIGIVIGFLLSIFIWKKYFQEK